MLSLHDVGVVKSIGAVAVGRGGRSGVDFEWKDLRWRPSAGCNRDALHEISLSKTIPGQSLRAGKR